MQHAVFVPVNVGFATALGRGVEHTVIVGPQAGDEEVAVEDVGIFQLPDVRRGNLVVGRLRLTLGSGAAAGLQLVVGPVVEHTGVVLGGLEVELGVEVFQGGLVELTADDDVADIAFAIGGPDPQLVFPQGTTDISAVLFDDVDLIALQTAVENRGARLVLTVRAQVAGADGPLITAALGDLIDGHARRGDGDVGATDGELDFFEGAEVIVRQGGAGGRHVGEDDAVDGEGVLRACRTGAQEVGLLAGLVTADVDAVHHHAGGLVEQRPRVAGGGNLVELRRRHVGAAGGLALVQERRLRGHGDDVFDGWRHGDVDGGGPADTNRDVRVFHRTEPFQLGAQRVLAGSQAEEAVLAFGVGHLDLGSADAG